jgi:hypothetical protein
VEENSKGSRGSQRAVELMMMMMMKDGLHFVLLLAETRTGRIRYYIPLLFAEPSVSRISCYLKPVYAVHYQRFVLPYSHAAS